MSKADHPRVIDLWPGPVPKDMGIAGEENTRIHDSQFVGKTKLITNVTCPSIHVHLPPAHLNTQTAMIICPGGGYWDLYWELEGEEVVDWLNANGIAGIMLKYRVPRRPNEKDKRVPAFGPQLDAQRAVSLVRHHATDWEINPNRIGMIGFSAGGHLALATATQFHTRTYDPIDDIDTVCCRPDFAVLCYSGFLKDRERDAIWPDIHIPSDTPPIFLTHARDDSVSEVDHSVIAYLALHRAGIATELHAYASGEHDFGVRQNETLPSSWPTLCLNWLRSLGLLPTT